jgi:hypothetical protein
VEPEGARYWAVTQVKGLSPEITDVSEAEVINPAEGRSLILNKRRGDKNMTGSETTARYQTEWAGTRETQGAPHGYSEVCVSKSGKDKLRQKALWESDQSIATRKQGNACGAKGLAIMDRGGRDTSYTHIGGQRKTTKLFSLSERARGNPQMRFTSLAHYLTVDFLRECFREPKRKRVSGVDGVTVEEYATRLEESLKDLVERLKAKRYRPLLANIYFHYCLDIWFEKRDKRQLRGYARLIRYADDFVICFEKTEEAERFGSVLRQRLAKFGLAVSDEKSRMIPFGKHPYYKARERG